MKKLTPSMVVALIALFVALSGTAVAASNGLILGSQIKDHSIAASKLTPNAVTFLHGQIGAQGPSGSQGPSGEQGSAGLNGGFDPSKVGIASGPQAYVSNFIARSEADCPTGTRAIGGGFSGIASVFISAPFGLTGWVVYGDSATNDSTQYITAYAICAAP